MQKFRTKSLVYSSNGNEEVGEGNRQKSSWQLIFFFDCSSYALFYNVLRV